MKRPHNVCTAVERGVTMTTQYGGHEFHYSPSKLDILQRNLMIGQLTILEKTSLSQLLLSAIPNHFTTFFVGSVATVELTALETTHCSNIAHYLITPQSDNIVSAVVGTGMLTIV